MLIWIKACAASVTEFAEKPITKTRFLPEVDFIP
jgi:hypothetical protein